MGRLGWERMGIGSGSSAETLYEIRITGLEKCVYLSGMEKRPIHSTKDKSMILI